MPKNPLQQPLFSPDSSWTPPLSFYLIFLKLKKFASILKPSDPSLKEKGAGLGKGRRVML